MRETFLVFGAPPIEEAEIAEVVDPSKRWIGTGPKVARFERDFRAYTGPPTRSPSTRARRRCTSPCRVPDLGRRRRGHHHPDTFVATVNAIMHAGGEPVWPTSTADQLNIDPARSSRQITPRTRAIVPVHFAGRPCDMDAIMAIARARARRHRGRRPRHRGPRPAAGHGHVSATSAASASTPPRT